jgi:hypothetical protein
MHRAVAASNLRLRNSNTAGLRYQSSFPDRALSKVLLAKVRFVRIDHRDHHPRTQKRCRKENHDLTPFFHGINRF